MKPLPSIKLQHRHPGRARTSPLNAPLRESDLTGPPEVISGGILHVVEAAPRQFRLFFLNFIYLLFFSHPRHEAGNLDFNIEGSSKLRR